MLLFYDFNVGHGKIGAMANLPVMKKTASRELLYSLSTLVALGECTKEQIANDLREIEREQCQFDNDRKLYNKKPSLDYYDTH